MNVLGWQPQMCGPSFQTGAKMMVFLDTGGHSPLWADATSTNLVAALVAWRRATTDELRRKLLLQWKNGQPGTLQTSAAARLELMDRTQAAQAATAAAHATSDGVPAPITAEASSPIERWRGPATSWRSPGTAKAAEARLLALWPAMVDAVGPRLGGFARVAPADCARWASVLTGREAAQQVRDAIGDAADPSLLGSLAALDALGNAALWNASCSHGAETMFAYLRASDGSLVMMWMPPEG
jgi:hypothetical protein